MNNLKITGIKTATHDFNNHHGCARIYIDRRGGKVWTNCETSGNSWTNYKDMAVVCIASKADFYMSERDNTITMAELRERADVAISTPTGDNATLEYKLDEIENKYAMNR